MAFDTALLLSLTARRPLLVGLGEPTHAEPAFPRLRNRLLETLAGQGFRSIAIESDRAAALAIDDYVCGRRDDVHLGGGYTHEVDPDSGLTHGFGLLPANRELIDWLRAHNETGEHITFHGFDAPVDITGAASPGPYLRELRDYLGVPAPELDDLLGDDSRWTDPAIMLEDATRSPGRSPEAAALRGLAENFRTMLYAYTPRRLRDSGDRSRYRAEVLASTAIGLLTYHAAMAEPMPLSERMSRLLGVRDALMARNLLDIVARERDRGPTLVFAGNAHLQRHPSSWTAHWDGQDVRAEWDGAGSIVSALLGERYVYIAGSLGASPSLGLHAPEPGTFEHGLGPDTGLYLPNRVGGDTGGGRDGGDTCADRDGGAPATRGDTANGWPAFPLDAETVAGCDAILHIGAGPGAVEAARISGLPGVTETRIEPGSDMPPYTWGDRFFFAGDDRMRPFATIVGHDVPDFDERSRLSGPGRYRVNVDVGRDEFRKLFGYGPEEFTEHSATVDFAEADRLMPHPAYGVQGWACVVDPGPETAAELDRLLEQARSRSLAREQRRARPV